MIEIVISTVFASDFHRYRYMPRGGVYTARMWVVCILYVYCVYSLSLSWWQALASADRKREKIYSIIIFIIFIILLLGTYTSIKAYL